MNKNAAILILIVCLILGGFPASVKAGWGQDGFFPAKTSLVSDKQRLKYQVNHGDTVWDIALETGNDVAVILNMNNLSERSVIEAGQVLNVPWERKKFHRVSSGDTLWGIASVHQVGLEQLINANPWLENPDCLEIGKVISLPSRTGLHTAVSSQPSRSLAGIFSWPVFGAISSGFGWRKTGFHHGLDIACPVGTPIRAAKAGRVTFTGTKSVYGRTVIIEHSKEIETLYAHASKIMVKKGQKVSRGQVIALVGVTGRTTGPHLHFQVNRNGKAVNPINYLR